MLNDSTYSLTQAISHTVAYSDIFDYPLTARELHRYLTCAKASFEEVAQALEETPLTQIGDYFTLRGREKLVSVRAKRQARSLEFLPLAIRYGRVLGKLPYIRMVALTGSLAVLNVSSNEDFDYMLVTARGRVWTARAFALAFNRLVRSFGHTICPNLIISENALEWSPRDLYSAREFFQMIPITGREVYRKLMKANEWVKEYLPNAVPNTRNFSETSEVWKILELPLRGKLGDHFERWEMERKIARFSRQDGFGEETIFNAEVCQGNFHHHRQWTQEEFEERLNALAAVPEMPRSATGGEVTLPHSPGMVIGANRS
jgi:hypothetical protein